MHTGSVGSGSTEGERQIFSAVRSIYTFVQLCSPVSFRVTKIHLAQLFPTPKGGTPEVFQEVPGGLAEAKVANGASMLSLRLVHEAEHMFQ